MTKEEASKLWPMVKAFSEGKQVQFYDENQHIWRDLDSDPYMSGHIKYRIKPERRKFVIFWNKELNRLETFKAIEAPTYYDRDILERINVTEDEPQTT